MPHTLSCKFFVVIKLVHIITSVNWQSCVGYKTVGSVGLGMRTLFENFLTVGSVGLGMRTLFENFIGNKRDIYI